MPGAVVVLTAAVAAVVAVAAVAVVAVVPLSAVSAGREGWYPVHLDVFEYRVLPYFPPRNPPFCR